MNFLPDVVSHWMNAKLLLAVLVLNALCLTARAAEATASPTPEPTASAATIATSVTELSASRAAAERSRIFQAGRAYALWLDQVARDSGSGFLQTRVFDRVTWIRLIAAAGALLLLSAVAVGLNWFVRRRAGKIQSRREQSVLQLGAAALRKPVALFLWMCGGAFAFMPIATGIAGRPTRVFFVSLLTAILYAGWIVALLWLALRVISAVEKRMRQWATRTGGIVVRVVVPIGGQALRLAVPLLGVILLLPLLHLPQNWTWVSQKAVGILLIAAFSVLLVRAINAIESALLSRHQADAPESQSARRIFTQVSVIRKIIVTAVVIIATGSILMMFDPVRQFGTSILASAGIAGVVIGFAAQKTLGNVLAGIQIALSQPLLIDDIVVVEGEFGQIEEITLTYVTVRTWDLRRMILPITYFVEKPFQNWSRVSTESLGTVVLSLDYAAPIGELRKELKRLVESNPNWNGKVCGLQVTDAKQQAIEVRALVSSADSGKAFNLRCDVREGLIQFLVRNYPESLPRVRSVNVADEQRREPLRNASPDHDQPAGKEHERGDQAPGVRPEDARQNLTS